MSEHLYAQAGGTVTVDVTGYTVPVGDLEARIIERDTGVVVLGPTGAGFNELAPRIATWSTDLADDFASGEYLVLINDGTTDAEPDRLTVNYFGQAPAVVAGNDAIATLAELRRAEPLDNVVAYPDDLVLACRDALIDALEHECRTAFVRRTRTEAFDDSVPMAALALRYGTASGRHAGPAVLATTVNGVAVDHDVTPVTVGRGGLVRRSRGAFGNAAELTYEYGYDAPPGRVKRAVRIGTAAWLAQELDSPIPDRATSWSTDAGTFSVVTAGVRGALFDVPELNAVVQAYAE